MANNLLTISMITREALRVLENNLTFAKGVNRQYDSKFAVEGAKIGNVVNARKPPRYVGRTGQNLSIEDAIETSVPVELTTQFGVDISFSSQDLALSVDDFSRRFITPAMAVVANKIDRDGLMLYQRVANTVGTPGTIPNALKTYLQAGQKLDEEAAPRDKNRSIVINPAQQVEIVDALKGLFQSSDKIADQYETGTMGVAGGFKWSMDQNVVTHQVGPLGGAPQINGANQGVASPTAAWAGFVTSAWTAAAANRLKKGDVFTIAGVFAVNPQTRQSTGALRQFVVTADTDSTAGGAATIPCEPKPIVSGAFQNVTGAPANGALITVLGAANTLTPQGMAYHRDAFTLATADLPLPGGVDMAARVSDNQLGISVRLVRAYNIATDQFPCRIDVLYGWAPLYSELACRIAG